MGNPKQKWTSEEEEALRAGVAKYGPGKWKFIQKDPEFNKFLHTRSNIDLKDKWRNMSAAIQGSREKLRPAKNKDDTSPSIINNPNLTSSNIVVNETPSEPTKEDSARELPDGKTVPKYDELIFEVLSSTKEPNGLEIGPIFTYIEQRIELPQNFRKTLGSKLRRFVQREKLEKVDTCYRIKNNPISETNTNNKKDNWPKPPITDALKKAGESLEEAAKTAAFKVAEAENASFSAADAVKEAEKIVKMAEEADSILQLAKEIFERCSRGEITMVA